MTWPEEPVGGHLGDWLSALIDGELTTSQTSQAEGHLSICPACRAERDMTLAMQRLVVGLPALDPPLPLLAGRPASTRPMVWAGVAAAVVGLGLLSATPPRHTVAPQMTHFVQVHAVSSGSDPVTQLAPAAVPASFGP